VYATLCAESLRRFALILEGIYSQGHAKKYKIERAKFLFTLRIGFMKARAILTHLFPCSSVEILPSRPTIFQENWIFNLLHSK
jgi:hypothetical protein